MTGLIWTFGAALAVLVALLAIPITLRGQFYVKQGMEGCVYLNWAFGLVRVKLPLKKKKKKDNVKKEKRSVVRQIKSETWGSSSVRVKSIKLLLIRIMRLLGDFWRSTTQKELTISARIGLDDPFETGRLWGLIGPVSALLAQCAETAITIIPEFTESVFELEGRGSIRFVPLRVLTLIAGLVLSPIFWRGVREIRNKRKTR